MNVIKTEIWLREINLTYMYGIELVNVQFWFGLQPNLDKLKNKCGIDIQNWWQQPQHKSPRSIAEGSWAVPCATSRRANLPCRGILVIGKNRYPRLSCLALKYLSPPAATDFLKVFLQLQELFVTKKEVSLTKGQDVGIFLTKTFL